MLGWVVLIACVILMYRVAEIENRSGLLWALITFGCCMGGSALVPIPFLGLLAGLFLSFMLMFAFKMVGDGNSNS